MDKIANLEKKIELYKSKINEIAQELPRLGQSATDKKEEMMRSLQDDIEEMNRELSTLKENKAVRNNKR